MKTPEVSLRRRLLARLWIPLAGAFLTGALLSFVVAYHFGKVVLDRWLLDSAMTLATQLRADTGHVSLDLPPSAVEMFEWDAVDRIYEEVTSPNGRRLFSNAVFPAAPVGLQPGNPQYYDASIQGNPVRVVAVAVRSPAEPSGYVTVQVAETKRKREELMSHILLVLVPLQGLVLIAAGSIIWYAVTSSLASLDKVALRLGRYEATSLRPLGDSADAPLEVRPLVHAIDTLIQKLSEARGVQQRFVANAAHQLRTPLATLQVNTERALRERDPSRHAEALKQLLDAVTRMRHLTQQLLTLTRSDPSASSALTLQTVSLAELARSELEHWVDAAAKREIDLGYDGPDTGATVRGEPQLLREVIANLVDNALRYGKVRGEVTVGVRECPLSLFVEDDGPGIPVEERERVVEPFYRLAQGRGNGCGLGLAIVREIAALHGAQLTISDHVPSGTRVELKFHQEASTGAMASSVRASTRQITLAAEAAGPPN